MEAFVTVTSFAVSNQISFCLVFKESEKDNSKNGTVKNIGYCGVDYQILE